VDEQRFCGVKSISLKEVTSLEEEVSRPDVSGSAEEAQPTQVRPGLEWRFAGQPVRVLFLCANNSARSQIAEALARNLSQGLADAYSAGNSPAAELHPEAARVIGRLGSDMSRHVPKSLDLFRDHSFDRIVVISDRASEEIPHFPDGSQLVFWSIPDPVTSEGTPQELARTFEHLTIELTARVRLLLTLLDREKSEQRRLQTNETTTP